MTKNKFLLTVALNLLAEDDRFDYDAVIDEDMVKEAEKLYASSREDPTVGSTFTEFDSEWWSTLTLIKKDVVGLFTDLRDSISDEE